MKSVHGPLMPRLLHFLQQTPGRVSSKSKLGSGQTCSAVYELCSATFTLTHNQRVIFVLHAASTTTNRLT